MPKTAKKVRKSLVSVGVPGTDGAALDGDATAEAPAPGDAAGKGGKPLRSVAPPPERWKEEPDEHDYPAAKDYLTLLLNDAAAEHAVAALERAPLVKRKAKDLLRASALALLPSDNPAVARDLAKVDAGNRLSPVLALR